MPQQLMTIRSIRFVLTAALLGLVWDSVGAFAARAAELSVKAQLQRIYAAQDAAIGRKDAAAFYSVCAPNFVDVDAQGRATTLTQDKANFATICANSRSIHTRGVVQSVAVLPDGSASALVKVRISAVSINPEAAIDTTETVRDVWVKTPVGWREMSSRTLATKSVARPVPLDSFRARPLKK